MTIAIEINGTRIEAQDEKAARKAMAKLNREERKKEAKRCADYQTATLKARSAAYAVLSRKLEGDSVPNGWRFYDPGMKWSEHLFRADPVERYKTYLHTEARHNVPLDHYGNTFRGACCNGAGFCWLIFLQDDDNPPVCYAIGVHEDTIALAECPTITIAQFEKETTAS